MGGPEWQTLKRWRKKKSFSGRKEKRADFFVESLKKGGGGLYRNDVTHFKSKKKKPGNGSVFLCVIQR